MRGVGLGAVRYMRFELCSDHQKCYQYGTARFRNALELPQQALQGTHPTHMNIFVLTHFNRGGGLPIVTRPIDRIGRRRIH
jgi:hypothetical protein